MRLKPIRAAIVALSLALSACDPGFDPIKPGDFQFSIFGYLDASADTQWIRVTTIRPVVTTRPDPLDARVTLEHLGTGRIVELRDSVFRFSGGDPSVGSEGVYLHNFWTTERIVPGATYRLVVQRQGRPPAEAEVKIPPPYDAEVWLKQARTNGTDLVRLAGLRHVAFAGTVTDFSDACGSGVVEQALFPVGEVDSTGQTIPLFKDTQSRKGCGSAIVEKREVMIVGSGDPWPAGQRYRAHNLGTNDVPSNISNAVGFVGGVNTTRLPYEECTIDTVPLSADYCRLRYDATSASVSAVVRDTLCNASPAAGVSVRLRELNPVAPAAPRVRATTSNGSGEFTIAGLQGPRRYALSFRRIVVLEGTPYDVYEEHEDTLELSPGARAAYRIGLRRIVFPCSI